MSSENELDQLRRDFFTARDEGFDRAAQQAFRATLDRHPNWELSPPLRLSPNGVLSEGGDYVEGDDHTFIPDRLVLEVFHANFGEALTAAELRLLKQCLCGRSLREISASEQVAYETRRNQMKRLLEKTGCSRQTDLLLSMLSLLVRAQLVESGTNAAFCAPLQSYLERHYPGAFRVFSFETRSGARLLIGDYGPLDGTPCVMLHSSVFTVFPLPQHADILDRLAIRLITPYRPGFFDVPLGGPAAAASAAHVEALSEFLGIFGLAAAPLIGHAYGATLALRLLAHQPMPSRRVVLGSLPHITPELRATLSLHVRAMFRLCETQPEMTERLTRALYASTSSLHQVAHILRQYFGGSATDMRVLEAGLTERSLSELLVDTGTRSIPGLVRDFGLVARPVPPIAAGLLANGLLVFGSEDRLSDRQRLRGVAGYDDVPIEVLEGFGRGTFMFRPEILLSRALDG